VNTAHSFTLSGVAFPGGEGDPLGIWEPQPVSFGAQATGPEVPTWHIQLPESPQEAEEILETKLEALALGQKDLARAKREVIQFNTRAAVAFGTDALAGEKKALLNTINAHKSPVAYSTPGRGEQVKIAQEEQRQWHDFMKQIQQMVSHYARIKTTQLGMDVGLTKVGWTGNFETTWTSSVSLGTMQTHLKAVDLALASRAALIEVVSVVMIGAAGLAVKATVPGGQVLLLPATWRFVRDVLQTLRKKWPELQHL